MKKKETLLEKAKKLPIRKQKKVNLSEEHLELGLAWMKDEIGLAQINNVLGKGRNSGNILYSMSILIKEAYRQGKIKIK